MSIIVVVVAVAIFLTVCLSLDSAGVSCLTSVASLHHSAEPERGIASIVCLSPRIY